MFVKIAGLVALTMTVSLVAGDETCLSPPTRSAPGRDVSFGNTMCPNQIDNCAALCKGGVLANTCDSDNNGVDSPFEDITYCFECTCADGSVPDLAQYLNTIPNTVCQRELQNCQYGYNQVGKSAPAGACTYCGTQYAVKPSWYSLIPTRSSTRIEAVAATTTSDAEAEATTLTGSATWSSSSITISSSTTSVSETTSTSSSSEVSSSPTTTSQPSTTVHTSTTTSSSSHTSSHASKTSTTSAAPVKSAGAAMLEPAMAAFGMGLAAVMVL